MLPGASIADPRFSRLGPIRLWCFCALAVLGCDSVPTRGAWEGPCITASGGVAADCEGELICHGLGDGTYSTGSICSPECVQLDPSLPAPERYTVNDCPPGPPGFTGVMECRIAGCRLACESDAECPSDMRCLSGECLVPTHTHGSSSGSCPDNGESCWDDEVVVPYRTECEGSVSQAPCYCAEAALIDCYICRNCVDEVVTKADLVDMRATALGLAADLGTRCSLRMCE